MWCAVQRPLHRARSHLQRAAREASQSLGRRWVSGVEEVLEKGARKSREGVTYSKRVCLARPKVARHQYFKVKKGVPSPRTPTESNLSEPIVKLTPMIRHCPPLPFSRHHPRSITKPTPPICHKRSTPRGHAITLLYHPYCMVPPHHSIFPNSLRHRLRVQPR